MFTADCAILNEALEKVSKVIQHTSLDKIYNYVLLELDGEKLSFTGSDGQVEITSNCDVAIKKPAKGATDNKPAAVNSKKLADILRNNQGKISFVNEGASYKISCEAARFSLAVRDGNDFPKIAPPAKSEIKVAFSQSDLSTSLTRLQPAVSNRNHRINLAGVFFDFNSEGLSLVATDGHRMAIDVLPLKDKIETNFILPKKAVDELVRLLSGQGKDKVEIVVMSSEESNRAASFDLAGTTVTSMLIPESYPDYVKVLPDEKTYSNELVIKREPMMDGVRQVSSIHDQAGSRIELKAQEGNDVIAITGSGNNGADNAHVDVQLASSKGSELECKVNSTYLNDLLKAFKGFDDINVAFKNGKEKLLCVPPSATKSKFKYVIMPVR